MSTSTGPATVIAALTRWFDHYNIHPDRTLGYRSSREFITSRANETTVVIASDN